MRPSIFDTGVYVAEPDVLNNRVRNLLYDFALTHLTDDHKEFTEDAVTELLSQSLSEIPVDDPNSLKICPDPFIVLQELHQLKSIPAYDEKILAQSCVIQHIKNSLKGKPGKALSEKIVDNNEYSPPYIQRMSPELTRRARRETPILGKTLEHIPHHLESLIPFAGLCSVQVKPIVEPVISSEKILKTIWELRTDEHNAIRSLFKSTSEWNKAAKKNTRIHFDHRSPSPPQYPEAPFIPIFPKSRLPGSGSMLPHQNTNPVTFDDFPAAVLQPLDVDDSKSDICTENMMVVDGWQTLHTSSPSTPSTVSAASKDDFIDQLMLESSPNTSSPPRIEELRLAKIDVFEIPRSRRIGGSHGRAMHPAAGKNYNTFLLPLIPGERKLDFSKTVPEKSEGSRPKLAGEPMLLDAYPGEDLEVEVKRLYENESLNVFLNEKLDPIPNSETLMAVPDLPPPNIHPPNYLTLPSCPMDMVLLNENIGGRRKEVDVFHCSLKKVKGMAALRLSLSWIPFTTKERLPNHLEIAKVNHLVDLDTYGNLVQEQIKGLFELAIVTESDAQYSENFPWQHFVDDEKEHADIDLTDTLPLGIILSRKDRSNMARNAVENECDEGATTLYTEDFRPLKRARLASDHGISGSQGDGNAFTAHTVEYDAPEDPLFWSTDSADYDKVIYTNPTGRDHPEGFNHHDYGFVNPESMLEQDIYMLEPRSASDADDLEKGAQVPMISAEGITENHLSKIISFAHLRSKKLIEQKTPEVTADNNLNLPSPDSHTKIQNTAPTDIIDQNTIRLPLTNDMPLTMHKYMASLDLLQKQALVRCLRSDQCAVELVERDSLAGVDLILDPHTAIIIISLLALPSRCSTLVDAIAETSWSFSRLLVLFEAYPSSYTFKSDPRQKSIINAYTPPIVKAVKKFRRDINIVEACGNKRALTRIQYAFANTVEESALLVRYVGDIVETLDETEGSLWGSRAWLDQDMFEDEGSLASLGGMNRFSASILLCLVTSQELLDMTPYERVEKFGPFFGFDAVTALNADLESRILSIQTSDIPVSSPSYPC